VDVPDITASSPYLTIKLREEFRWMGIEAGLLGPSLEGHFEDACLTPGRTGAQPENHPVTHAKFSRRTGDEKAVCDTGIGGPIGCNVRSSQRQLLWSCKLPGLWRM